MLAAGSTNQHLRPLPVSPSYSAHEQSHTFDSISGAHVVNRPMLSPGASVQDDGRQFGVWEQRLTGFWRAISR